MAVSGLVLSLATSPSVGHRDGFQAVFGLLAGEAAELMGQRHVGAQFGRVLTGDRGHVDGIGHGAGQQVVGNLFRHLKGHVLLRFRR